MAIKPIMQFRRATTEINGLKLTDVTGYKEKPTCPTLISRKLSMNNQTLAEYSTKDLGNGLKLETYYSNGSNIKLLKNQYGDFVAFKTNIEAPHLSREHLLANMQNVIKSAFSDFLNR